MFKWYLGKHKRLIIAVATIAVLAVVLAFASYQELIGEHMYPQAALHESSNLSVRGVVTAIEENYERQGFGYDCYHIFRHYIRLNITEVVWVKDNSDWITFSNENHTISGFNSIGVGYDNLDNPQLFIGQTVECKGYYLPALDSPYSSIITVSPSISESYLKLQV